MARCLCVLTRTIVFVSHKWKGGDAEGGWGVAKAK